MGIKGAVILIVLCIVGTLSSFAISSPVFSASTIADKGDINNDGVVNILDFNLVVSCFGKRATSSSCLNKTAADVNKDGVVDGVDYTIVLKYFGMVADTVTPTANPASFDQDLQSIDSSLNQLDSDLNSVDLVLTPTP